MWGSTVFWLPGYLVYLPLGVAVSVYNGFQWYNTLFLVLNAEPGDLGYEFLNFWNWVIYPWRKSVVWDMLFIIGAASNAIPGWGPFSNLLWCFLMYVNMIDF